MPDQIADEDRVTLSSLIDDIENFLTDLRGRPTVSTSNRVLVPTMLLTMLDWKRFLDIKLR